MSERVKAIIGDDLYTQVLNAGIKADEFDLTEGLVSSKNTIPYDRFKEVNDKLKAEQGKITEYEKLSGEFKKLIGEKDDLKSQYEKAIESHQSALATKDQEFSEAAKVYLVTNALEKSGAQYAGLLVKEMKERKMLESISVENGNLLGYDKVVKDLKKDFAGLFAEKTTQSNIPPKQKNGSNNDELAGSGGAVDWEARFKQFIV
jgi:hypothetical protein